MSLLLRLQLGSGDTSLLLKFHLLEAKRRARFMFEDQESAVALYAWEKSEEVRGPPRVTPAMDYRSRKQELTCQVSTMN